MTPHTASVWAKGYAALPLDEPPKGLTDAVLPDEFPLSMFDEALAKKVAPQVRSASGIVGTTIRTVPQEAPDSSRDIHQTACRPARFHSTFTSRARCVTRVHACG